MTERDSKVLEFIQQYKLCTANQIYNIFFSGIDSTVCNRRLKYLDDYGYIQRFKFDGNGYVYYAGEKPSPRIVKHDLYITDFIIKLINEGYEIIEFKKSFVLGNIISDAYIKVSKSNKIKTFLLEVQLGTHDCISKYKNIKQLALEHTNWEVLPRLVVASNIDIKEDIPGLKISYVNLKMEGEI